MSRILTHGRRVPAAIRSWAGRRHSPDGSSFSGAVEYDEYHVPIPPPALRGLVTGWDDTDQWLRSGAQDADLIRGAVASAGVELDELHTILDFACGCGRVARWWRGLDGPEIFGTDYDPALTAWCRQNLHFMHVETNAAAPPVPFDDGQFDLIYAISLFTHLTVPAQEEWMLELARVLAPDGMLLFTAHGEIFTNHLTDGERIRYARGEVVVHHPEINGEQACAAFHPREYVEGTLLPRSGLELRQHTPGDWTHGQIWTPMVLQDKYVATKARLRS